MIGFIGTFTWVCVEGPDVAEVRDTFPGRGPADTVEVAIADDSDKAT